MSNSIAGILLCLLAAGPVMAAEVHLIGPGTSTQQPVSPASMNQRLEAAAIKYRQYAPIPRVGFIDIAFPANAQEHRSLNGYGLLLVVALSQESTELPPKRLYGMVKGREVELKLLTSASSIQDPQSTAGIVFGSHRWEGLYAFPVYFSVQARELRIDFGANRDGFSLTRFSGDEDGGLGPLAARKPKASGPSGAALIEFVRREFPGFVRD